MASQNSTSTQLIKPGPQSSRRVIFISISILLIPSILASIFVLYNFISLKSLRRKPTNRFIIALAILNFAQVILDLPCRLYFLSENTMLIQHPIFCLLWTWYDNILTILNLYIMAISSIERYIFVFHRIYFECYSFLSFNISMFICIFIPTSWYTGLIFIYPCKNILSYSRFQCGGLCYLFNLPFSSYFEDYVFSILPIGIIIFANSLLIIRILIQKNCIIHQQDMTLWCRNIRTISHLFSVGILYMCIYIPSAILLLISTSLPSNQIQIWANNIRINYFFHLKYIVILGCPFMILASQTRMHKNIKKIIGRFWLVLKRANTNQVLPLVVILKKK